MGSSWKPPYRVFQAHPIGKRPEYAGRNISLVRPGDALRLQHISEGEGPSPGEAEDNGWMVDRKQSNE